MNSAPLDKLVYSLQNHDFIGNHPAGTRIHESSSPEAQRAAAALLLLLPSVPMLFMGEEFSSPSPFYFFVDFKDSALRRSVEQGRKRDHPQHDWSATASPTSPEAFLQSKIGPSTEGDANTLSWYKALIRCRKDWQKKQLLETKSLKTSWDPDYGVAMLQYENAGENRFLLARLHARGATADSVAVEIQGTVLLSQNYVTDESNIGVAKPFAAIAGEGTVAIRKS